MKEVEAHFSADASAGQVWLVEGATIRARLNRPYYIEIELRIDESEGAEPLSMLGSSAELRFGRGGTFNAYSGLISSLRPLPSIDNWQRLFLTLEPALAALRFGRDTRIFQEKTVPDILREVLSAELGAYGREVSVRTQRSYPEREYCVQYQESHFDFAHRLMEEEGIVYFFEESGGVEAMVLIDAPTQHPAVQGQGGALLEYSEADEGTSGLEYVRNFVPRSSVQETEVATRHFDWTHPAAMIAERNDRGPEGEHPNGSTWGPKRESYEHDEPLTQHQYNVYYGASDVQDQIRLRRERQVRDALLLEARSSVTALRHGQRFDLNGHPEVSLNASYVVIEQTHHVLGHIPTGQEADAEEERYLNQFVCLPAATPWRPERAHKKPRIKSIQTAIVTGPAGEEIHTDVHGRIKCQFHWDRLGTMDERSSMWIRVMQTWAGAGWGAFVLPRIGMEVVVSFVDGDPDRPLVTGCVYNGDNKPPYNLPEHKTKSTFKSNSSLGGGGYNEFRFEDKAGEEEIFTHAQKDYNEVVENDHSTMVHHDQKNTVDVDQSESVGRNQIMTVGSNREKVIGVNETVMVGNDREETVGRNETIMVGKDRDETVGENEKIRVGNDRYIRVRGNNTLKVSKHIDVLSDEQVVVRAGNSTILVKKK